MEQKYDEEVRLSHEGLDVYHKALAFLEETERLMASWGSRHAIADHLPRAAESIIINLAEGCRKASQAGKLKSIDTSFGSGLECAGCLDIAREKRLSSREEVLQKKRPLAEVVRMLFGLRRSWMSRGARETSPRYEKEEPLFPHEKLDVYEVGLAFTSWLNQRDICQKLNEKLFGKLDRAATSVVLNIAEGNDRFAELDRNRFLNEANRAAVRASAYLDIAVRRHALTPAQVRPPKRLLTRTARMTAAMGHL
jgi:four helix bundle protein